MSGDAIQRNMIAARQLLDCAAEIERLRAENAELRKANDTMVMMLRGSGAVNEQQPPRVEQDAHSDNAGWFTAAGQSPK